VERLGGLARLGPPTRYGYYGLNCKNKPSGSGTTHSNRNAQTAHKQWSNLIIARPDAEESLVEQAAALEKAAKRQKSSCFIFHPV